MSSVNRVILIGNVGNDPEVRATSGGTRIAKLSLATNYKHGDGREDVEWHRLTVFGKLVDVVEQWVHKGDRLYIEGRLKYSTTEHEGTTRYWTEIIVERLTMLGSASGNGGKREERRSDDTPAAAPATGGSYGGPDDDLPF